MDKETFEEFVLKVSCKNKRVMFCVDEIIVFLCLLYCLSRHAYVVAAIEFVFLLYCFGLNVFYPKYLMKKQEENISKLHNGNKPESVIRFSDKIYLTEGTFSVSFEYSQIIKIYNLKRSMVLMYSKQSGLIVKPNCFSVGTFEDFKKFINQKCGL